MRWRFRVLRHVPKLDEGALDLGAFLGEPFDLGVNCRVRVGRRFLLLLLGRGGIGVLRPQVTQGGLLEDGGGCRCTKAFALEL